jgi:hypothetical protein
MRVIETRNISDILQCIPMELEIRKKGRDVMPIRDMLSLLKQNFEHNPCFKFYMIFADEGDTLLGYIGLIVRPEKEVRTIHLYRIWHDGTKEVLEKLKEIIKLIAKETKCKRLTVEVYKDEKALERVYGFKKHSTIMERRI